MNKSRQEKSVRKPSALSKSGKSFHRRNRKTAEVRKQQHASADEQNDLQFRKMTNGMANRKNEMKSKPEVPLGRTKAPTGTTPDNGGISAQSKKSIAGKTLGQSEPNKACKAAKAQAVPPSKSESGQKRKAQNSNGIGTKSKKQKKFPLPESDSDADDYIDQFFGDVPDDELSSKRAQIPEDSTNDSSEEDDDSSDSSEDDESEEDADAEEEGNVMSLEELVDYYGLRRDERTAEQNTGKKRKQSQPPQPNNGWVEEDNDVELVYKDSDDEEGNRSSRALVPVGDVRSAEYDDEGDDDEQYSSDSEEEEEYEPFDLAAYLREQYPEDETDYSDEEEDSYGSDSTGSDSFEEGSEEDDSDDASAEEQSPLNDHEFSSDFDSDEDDDSLEDDDGDEEFPSYWDDSYDSADDEDYVAEGDDDLYICRGTARVYSIDDNEVTFNSDVETAQIVELPAEGSRSRSVGTSEGESQEDDVECPILVPIYDARGMLIDSPEKLEELELNKAHGEKNRKSKTETTANHKQASTDAERVESDQQNEMEVDVEQNEATESYRFYDAIDMRISLLILKETIYFSGHLTIQPLIGGLEVMGYTLSPGECRSAFAVRGFHNLNLKPRFQATPSSKDTMEKVMARLEKHFHEADLKEILNTFDSSDSVLVLLQADFNNKRIDTVDKYLSEDFLFPKVEYLKKSAFFRTEYLLNVEFYLEHVDKSTSLYRTDPEWEKIAVKKNSKILVMGGKASGKSTLCQYLINKGVEKFKKVVLIDLDIGQPIQYIPETISVTIIDRPLLGVATFNPIPPVKSWLFGSLDIVSSLIFYTQNVRQLVKYCEQHKSDLGNVPWIINTMGYVTDFGEELMNTILRMLSPTDVIQLVSTNRLLAIPNFQNRFTSEFVNQHNYNILRSEVQEFIQRKASFKHYEFNVCYPKKGFTLNAPKRRNLMLLAHLADILHDSSNEWFNDVKPFCAPLNQLQVLITREDQTLGDDQLPSVLNATLVYLCRKDDAGLYECLGIGIVRGVDKNNNVYLLQSLPEARLALVNVLAICSSSLPNAVFLRQSTRIQGTIPYVYNVD